MKKMSDGKFFYTKAELEEILHTTISIGAYGVFTTKEIEVKKK